MKIKNWLAAAAVTIFPKAAASEVFQEKQDTIPTSIEVLTDTVPSEEITAPADSLLSDAEIYELRLNLLRESKKDMLLLIAHFEAITPRAHWDKVAKQYSVGLGFTRKKNGQLVDQNTVIHSKEELMDYWERFTEDNMFPQMAQTLSIEKTDHQERVALASTAFNCGVGIYKVKDCPSKYAETLNTFFETRDSIYLNKALHMLESRNKSRGVVVEGLAKRRRIEADILSHKIIIVQSDTVQDTLEFPQNAIDLNKLIIGATTSIGKLPTDSVELATKIREFNICGHNYEDSIKKAFKNPSLPANRRPKKTAATPKPRGNAGGNSR